jgi:sugar/nucleoside kinase (ribokinase family)
MNTNDQAQNNTERPYRVCGFGNAIVDIFIKAHDGHLEELSIDKGTMRLVEHHEQAHLLDRLGGKIEAKASGGSVANSLAAFAQLGGAAALIAVLGDDDWGNFYVEEFSELGIQFEGGRAKDQATATCLSIVTPDAERSMRTCLSASALLGPEHVKGDVLGKSDWIFIEGYPFANPEKGRKGALEAIEKAKQSGVKIALSCSESWVIEHNRETFENILQYVDLLFANEAEALTLTQTQNIEDAFQNLKMSIPGVAITRGPNGAWIRWNGEEARVPSPSVEAIDTTGAGDMFAGAFLYGIIHGIPLNEAASRACFLASKVISQMGARFVEGARIHWDSWRLPG